MEDGTDRSMRRSSSATEDEGSTNITPPKTPDNDIEAQRYVKYKKALDLNVQGKNTYRTVVSDKERYK